MEKFQNANIEKRSRHILDARGKCPDGLLADLYDPLTIPPERIQTYRNFGHVMMKLYKLSVDFSKSTIVAALMRRYQELTQP